MKTSEWYLDPHPPLASRLLASGLRSMSQGLARLSRLLRRRLRAPDRPPVLEFYAEAGAPEGALYLDGQLLGRLPGVTRL
jgi:hypothetical protein